MNPDECDDNIEDDYHDDVLDEYEEALGYCSLFRDGDTWVCMAVGSEYCDWECLFSDQIGDPVEYEDEEA